MSLSLFENIIIIVSFPLSKAICMTWFLLSPDVYFLCAFWEQYHQILFNLVQLSNPPSVPLISVPRPFSHLVDLVFCRSLPSVWNIIWKKKITMSLFPVCQWKSFKRPPFGMTWKCDSFWLHFCMCQPRHFDHVKSEHIQGERQLFCSISASL